MTVTQVGDDPRPTARISLQVRGKPRGRSRALIVNDYAGHPFQIDLSRELARRGIEVTHLYCATNVTPRGDLSDDPELRALTVTPIGTGQGFAKYDVRRRLVAELRYGWASAVACWRRRPATVLAANMPVVSLLILRLAATLSGARCVVWLQDRQAGLAALAVGSDRHPVARALTFLENTAIRSASAVVAISEELAEFVRGLGVPDERVVVIENWAPIADLPVRPRRNAWSQRMHLEDGFNFVYTGTLGVKHRPELLVELADNLRTYRSDARVVVVSEGVGAEWISDELRRRPDLDNLVLLPFQNFDDLPDVMCSADVLIALLEPDAAGFCVPSKVLSYLCAARPIVALMPSGNAAERTLRESAGAGLAFDTPAGFLEAARRLSDDLELRLMLGKRGRAWAEANFPIGAVADRFEHVLLSDDQKGSQR